MSSHTTTASQARLENIPSNITNTNNTNQPQIIIQIDGRSKKTDTELGNTIANIVYKNARVVSG